MYIYAQETNIQQCTNYKLIVVGLFDTIVDKFRNLHTVCRCVKIPPAPGKEIIIFFRQMMNQMYVQQTVLTENPFTISNFFSTIPTEFTMLCIKMFVRLRKFLSNTNNTHDDCNPFLSKRNPTKT